MLEKNDPQLKAIVLRELGSCTPEMISDSYGNYVAQHVIKHGDAASRERMIGIVLSSTRTFTKHKFASNVVEKCIAYGSLQQQVQILDSLLDSAATNSLDQDKREEGLLDIVRCPYGNYVIRKFPI